MPHRLDACPSCARHIRIDARTCPFCRGRLPGSFRTRLPPVPPPAGLDRWTLAHYRSLGVCALASAAALAACSSGSTPALPQGAMPLADDVPYMCMGQVYRETHDFPTLCEGQVAFLLCDGDAFAEYTCTDPGGGWSEVQATETFSADYGAPPFTSTLTETQSSTSTTSASPATSTSTGSSGTGSSSSGDGGA